MSKAYRETNKMVLESHDIGQRTALFMTLLGDNKCVPLDRNGKLSIIDSGYYREMTGLLTEGQTMRQKIEEKCHAIGLTNVALEKDL